MDENIEKKSDNTSQNGGQPTDGHFANFTGLLPGSGLTVQAGQNSAGFISLAEASKLTGYHQDYLGFLCRNGKLKGFKLGRNWVTTQADVDEFVASYKNGINEVVDETGTKIQVHVEKQIYTDLKDGLTQIQTVNANEEQGIVLQDHIKTIKEDLENTQKQSEPAVRLNNLRNEVFENLENRIQNISSTLSQVEQTASEKKTQSEGHDLNLLAVGYLPESRTTNLNDKFVSNFDFGNTDQDANLSQGLHADQSKFALGKEKIKNLYQSFTKKPDSNLPVVFAAVVIALMGLLGSLLWSNFSTQEQLAKNSQGTKIFYGGKQIYTNQNGQINTNTAAGNVIVNRTVNQLLGFTGSDILNLIDNRLNQYLTEGKFKGQPGPQGPQGPAGNFGSGITYIQPSVGSGVVPGSLTGFTYLSATSFVADTANINNLTVQGGSTFNGGATFNSSVNLNGTTTALNLNAGNLNLGFIQGSVVFQGVNGLTQDNGNLFYTASTSQLSIGTSTPDLSAILQLESTNKGFLAPRMTQAQRDAIVSPATGLFVFDTDSNGYEVYNGTSWAQMGSSNVNASVATGTPNSFAYYSSSNQLNSQNSLFISGGNIGIGTTTPANPLTVVGDALLTGNETLLGQLAVSSTSTLATTTITDLTVAGTARMPLLVASTANIFDLNVATGTVSQLLLVTGQSSLATTTIADLSVSGNAVIGGNATTTGNSVIGGNQIISGTLAVAGALFDSSNASGTNGMILSSIGTGTQWISTSTLVGGNALVSLNGLTTSSQVFATSTSGGLDLFITSSGNTHTFALQPATNYTIPLGASTTQWTNFYNTPSTRIADGNNLTWNGNTLNVDDVFPTYTYASGTFPSFSYGTSTYVNYGYASSTFPSFTYASNTFQTVLTIATGTAGNIFNANLNNGTLTLNLPYASGVNTGQLQGTDWLTFNNKLSGSGTANYLVKYTGASTTANSLLYDNGTSLSLNSSTPGSLFVVQGSSTLPTIPIFSVASSNNASLMTVLANGNVGIGTANPNNLFQVKDLVNFINSDAATFIGYQAGANHFTTTGQSMDNTYIGYQAGYSMNSWISDSNTVVGSKALYSAQTVYNSAVLGDHALYLNTDGDSNTAMGSYSLYNTQGASNTALGYRSGYANTNGGNNLFLGWQAGDNLTTGGSNILIGFDIDTPATNSSNFLSIGNLIFATGGFGTGTTIGSGNVGIGTSSTASAGLTVGSAASGKNVRIANGYLCVDNNDTCSGANTAGGIYSVSAATTGADVAENYPTLETSLIAGEVVTLDPLNDVFVMRASSGSSFLGVISTQPGMLLSGFNAQQYKNDMNVPVTLTGRVPVKVSAENGNIKPGDYLTISKTLPGVAVKATVSGEVIGQALQSYTSTTSVGSVLVYIKQGYQNINNTFVLGANDGQLTTATSTFTIISAASSSEVSMLINQKGTGNLLQLQSGGQDRLLIANDGSMSIFASSSLATSTILTVKNSTTTLFTISAAGHLTVGKDTAGTATIKAGDNETTVSFAVPYDSIPKVVITAQGLPNFFYGVATKTPESFSIQISATSSADTTFDWIALAQPVETVSVSTQNLLVLSSPMGPISQINPMGQISPISPINGAVAGTSTPDSIPAPPPAGDGTPTDSVGATTPDVIPPADPIPAPADIAPPVTSAGSGSPTDPAPITSADATPVVTP